MQIRRHDLKGHEPRRWSVWVNGNWRLTFEILGVWERLNNADFKPLEFEGFRNRASLNSFILTLRQWIDATHAIGLVSKSGHYGGTYTHNDIAFDSTRPRSDVGMPTPNSTATYASTPRSNS